MKDYTATVTIDKKDIQSLIETCVKLDIPFYIHEHEVGDAIKVTFDNVTPAMMFYIGRMVEDKVLSKVWG